MLQVNVTIIIFFLFTLGSKTVEVKELHRKVVPVYAARWRDLGVELGIPIPYLDTIAVDNVHHPSYSQKCCKAVLQKWMEITPEPTWNILQNAIDRLPSLSNDGSSESKK